MSLQLDARQRAMLAEMGVRTFGSSPPMDTSQQRSATKAQAPARQPMVAAPPVPGAAVELLQWDALAQAVAGCRACRLCEGRRNAVFGVGDRRPDWLIVGEAPDEQEDLAGEPFAGESGRLLDNMLKALGLDRHHKVYLANLLKCSPPGGRNPQPQEVALCEPFLRRQVQLLKPKIILAMGRFAVQTLLATTEPLGKLRGREHSYLGIPVFVTYHPVNLLRNLPDKAKAWADLCLARQLMQSLAAEPGRT